MKLYSPAKAPVREVVDIHGNTLALVSDGCNTLLCFFRDAACPFCNLRVHVLASRYVDFQKQGLQVIAVFASTPDEIRRFVAHTKKPFPVIADPDGKLYDLYGIERSFMKKLRAVITRLPDLLRGLRLVGVAGFNTNNVVPADFLISRSGSIVEAYYGKDAGDHMPLERIELLIGMSPCPGVA